MLHIRQKDWTEWQVREGNKILARAGTEADAKRKMDAMKRRLVDNLKNAAGTQDSGRAAQ